MMFSRGSFGEAPFAAEPVASGGGFTLLPALGLLVLTGFEPSFPKTVTPGLGEVTVTGLAPQFPRTIVTGQPGGSLIYGDTLTDTDSVVLVSHTPTGPNAGAAWSASVTTGADFVIAANRIRGNVGGYSKRQDTFSKGSAWPDDYTVKADAVFKSATTDDYVYIGGRSPASGTGGYYFGYETHAGFRHFRLIKGNGHEGTSLGVWTYAFPAADTVEPIELVMVGTTISGKVGGVTRISVTDSDYSSGSPSVYFAGSNAPENSTSVHFDNFEVTSSTGGASLELTGFAPSISTVAVGYTLNAGFGQLDLTGFAPTLGLPRTIVPGVGALDLTGFPPTFPRLFLPGTGQLTLDGFAPTLGLPKTIVPGFGQLTLTGFSPQFAKTIVPSTGLLNLTGFSPAIGLPQTLRPGLGALDLNGFAPSITFVTAGFTLQPGVGALSLSGFAPAIGLPRTLVPGTGVLDLTGFAPTIGLPFILRPGLGVLSLTGYGISLQPPGIFILPGTGQLLLTGYAPQFGTFTFRISGGPVMTATITAGGVLVASVTGGPVLTGSMRGGPV